MSQELNDYISAYTGTEIDQMLNSAADAKEYAERAEQALLGIVDIEKAAPMIIGQVVKNRDAIGLVRVNLLPIPDGDLELSTVPAGGLPSTISITGSRATGGITVSIDDVVYQDTFFGANVAKLSMLGTGADDTGAIQPGTYKLSFTDTSTDQILSRQRLEVNVVVDSTATTYSCTLASACQFVVPDNFEYVEITYKADVERFSGVASSIIYPFLRELALADEPFEPYKPDLQTQINALPQAENVARLTDAVGTDGSINLFPIDKGSSSEPLEVQGNNGVFYIAKGDSPSDPSMVQYYATSAETELEQEDVYETKFNDHYDFEDTGLYGDLVPDEYLFSFDVSADRQNFTTHGKFSYKIYQAQSPLDDFELIAVCEEGQTVSFTVTKEKPYIMITAFAEKFENQSWEGDYIITYPFLRHKTFETESYDIYKPSLNKRVSRLDEAQDSMKAGFDRLTDTVGTDGSINLFPIDKGVPGDPVIVEDVGGDFAVQQGNDQISPFIAFEGTSDDSNREEYRIYFNNGYRFGDNPWLFGDIVPGDYVLSFDILDDVGFTDVADFVFEIYENAAPPSLPYGDLIATCTGSDTEFTVTAAKPFITILAVAKRHDGESWVGDSIAVTPFLRRAAYRSEECDRYKPSISKQLAQIRDTLANMGGYNETQSDSIIDSVREVTT